MRFSITWKVFADHPIHATQFCTEVLNFATRAELWRFVIGKSKQSWHEIHRLDELEVNA